MIDYKERWVILDILAGLILTNRKGCVVEIGIGPDLRSSTGALMKRAKEANVKFYTCDVSKGKAKVLNDLYDYPKHTHFLGNSESFMEQFDDTPAVVFIDGLHSGEMVLKESRFFLDIMMEGGVLFLHDTFPPKKSFLISARSGDVYKARQELEKEMNCFTWPYTAANAGLTMIIKHADDRPYFRM